MGESKMYAKVFLAVNTCVLPLVKGVVGIFNVKSVGRNPDETSHFSERPLLLLRRCAVAIEGNNSLSHASPQKDGLRTLSSSLCGRDALRASLIRSRCSQRRCYYC